MDALTFTKSGTKATTATKLSKDVFGLKVENHELIKQAYVAYLSNGRQSSAVVKTRGLVRGGGRKPWKQKGTGRARFGSIRNPIWRGGGIVFGPTGNENYKKSLTTQSKRLALRQALSLNSENIKIADIQSSDGKVKPMVALLDKLSANRNVLIVVKNKSTELSRATNNIPYVKLVQAKYLNVYDIVNANSIIITKQALEIIQQWLGSDK